MTNNEGRILSGIRFTFIILLHFRYYLSNNIRLYILRGDYYIGQRMRQV